MSQKNSQNKVNYLQNPQPWVEELLKDNDRASGIVGAAFIEVQLEQLLLNFLIDDEAPVKQLFGYDKPLGTFSSKISMAYCLGLISPNLHNDLNIIRSIRNDFAHNLQAIDFTNQSIADKCKNFKLFKISDSSISTTRHHFLAVVSLISIYLAKEIEEAKKEKRKIQGELAIRDEEIIRLDR